jgi:hypothetical protein
VAHVVDLDLILRTSDRPIVITWERDGLVEGLSDGDLECDYDNEDHVLVPESDQWAARVGANMRGVHLGWHETEVGCPARCRSGFAFWFGPTRCCVGIGI